MRRFDHNFAQAEFVAFAADRGGVFFRERTQQRAHRKHKRDTYGDHGHTEHGTVDSRLVAAHPAAGSDARGGELKGRSYAPHRSGCERIHRDNAGGLDFGAYALHRVHASYSRRAFHPRGHCAEASLFPRPFRFADGGNVQHTHRAAAQGIGCDLVVAETHDKNFRLSAHHADHLHQRICDVAFQRAHRSVFSHRSGRTIEGDVHASFPAYPARKLRLAQIYDLPHYAVLQFFFSGERRERMLFQRVHRHIRDKIALFHGFSMRDLKKKRQTVASPEMMW